MPQAGQLASLLKQLSELCDTGFVLAIHIRYTRPSLMFQTYSAEWNDYYSQNGLMLVDPTVRWGLENTGLVHWDSLREVDEAGVVAKAQEFGLSNGMSYSVGGPESRTLAGFSKSGAPFDEAAIDRLTNIVDHAHALTADISNFSDDQLARLRAIDLSEY